MALGSGAVLWGLDQTVTGGYELATGEEQQTFGGQALSKVFGKTAGNLMYDLGPPTTATINTLRNAAGSFKNILRNPSKLADDVMDLADEVGAPKSVTRYFNGDEAIQHFNNHASGFSDALGRSSYNLKNYLDDANHVIAKGTFVPELNGYVRLIGGKGSAKYGFVGLERGTNRITTLHIKTVKELMKKAPSLGFGQ